MATKKEYVQAYDEYNDALFRHAVIRVSNRDVAIDLVQDSFVKTWEYIQNGNQVRNLRAFLYRTLNNAIIDYYRKSKSYSLDEIEEVHESVDFLDDIHDEQYDRWVDQMDGVRLLEEVNRLPDMYKQVLIMRYIDGFSPQEIAEMIEESANVVSVRIHRAKKRIRAHVSENQHG